MDVIHIMLYINSKYQTAMCVAFASNQLEEKEKGQAGQVHFIYVSCCLSGYAKRNADGVVFFISKKKNAHTHTH